MGLRRELVSLVQSCGFKRSNFSPNPIEDTVNLVCTNFASTYLLNFPLPVGPSVSNNWPVSNLNLAVSINKWTINAEAVYLRHKVQWQAWVNIGLSKIVYLSVSQEQPPQNNYFILFSFVRIKFAIKKGQRKGCPSLGRKYA